MVTACANAERRAYSWTYDNADRVTSFTSPDSATATTYTYDHTDQLTGATYAYQGNESYTYDENGNRTSEDPDSYQTGPFNRITRDAQDNIYEYTDDDGYVLGEGNRIRRISANGLAKVEYGWDHRNRLVSVENYTRPDVNSAWVQGKTVSYNYSVFDHRVAKTTKIGALTWREAYVYDGQNVALLFRGTGSGNLGAYTLNHGFLYGQAVDQVLADQTNGSGSTWDARWMLADNLGTIRDVVKYTPDDGSGGGDMTTIIDHLRYDAFGKITSQTYATEQPRFTYTARELDADTGLYYYRARWYDAATGKFMSEDPIDFRGGDENLYRYVGNRAVNAVDPSGLLEWPSVQSIYQEFKQFAELLSGVRFPELPRPAATKGDWQQMFMVWFFELSGENAKLGTGVTWSDTSTSSTKTLPVV